MTSFVYDGLPVAWSVTFCQTRGPPCCFFAISQVAGFQKMTILNFREGDALITHRMKLLTSRSVSSLTTSHSLITSDGLKPPAE